MSASDRYPIEQKHFIALRGFRAHEQTRKLKGKQADQAWAGVLQGAKLAFVPLGAVEQGYRDFLQGESRHSGLSCSPDEVLPGVVCVQHTYRGTVNAAHRMPVEALMRSLMPTFRRGYDTEEEALVHLLEIFQHPRRRRS